jgi:hypothetical protein
MVGMGAADEDGGVEVMKDWNKAWREHFERKRKAWRDAGGSMTLEQAMALMAEIHSGPTSKALAAHMKLLTPTPDTSPRDKREDHKEAP